MCLALPARIQERSGEVGRVLLGDAVMTVSLVMTPHAGVGDWVLVHAGFAIQEVSDQDARETWMLFDEHDVLAPARPPEGSE